MQNPEFKISEITPNYTTEQAERAEVGLKDLIKQGQILGVKATSVELTPNKIIKTTEKFSEDRLKEVRGGLVKEGLELESLSVETLSDRLLGIDGLIDFNGKTFGIDVTTGKGSVLYNKITKAKKLQSLYRELGIDHFIILRLRQEITDGLVLDFFGKLEQMTLDDTEQSFVKTIKYGVNEQPANY
jgi:hypothetical protein